MYALSMYLGSYMCTISLSGKYSTRTRGANAKAIWPNFVETCQNLASNQIQ